MDTYIYLLITMAFSAFFSGMEIAFVSVDKLRFEMERKDGVTSRILSYFFRNSNNFISTMLVGNNIALVIYGILMAQVIKVHLLGDLISNDFVEVLLQTVISTLIILVTGEFLPKTLFKINPNLVLKVCAFPLLICYVILYPISQLSSGLSYLFLRMFGMKINKEASDKAFGKVDLDYFVQSSIDNAEDEEELDTEVKIFQNALDFSSIKIRDCIVPRTEVVAVDLTTSLEELKSLFVESGISKIIVYDGNIDNVVGYIHSSEMFRNPADWRNNVKEVPIVPETMAAHKLMKLFMQQKKTIAVGAMVCSLIIPVLIQKVRFLRKMPWLYAAAGIIGLLAVLAFGITSSGAKISISIAGISVQPSEFVKIIFVFFVACMLYENTDLKHVCIATVLAAVHVLILVLSRDLGGALIFFVTYLVMLYVATRKLFYFAGGLLTGCIAAVVAYQLFSHVRVRVLAWQDPLSRIENEGYQICQSLFAIGTGGWFGMGLYQGMPEKIPVVEQDFIFSAIAEEMGGIFAICLLMVCISCFLMFFNVAMQMKEQFYKLIALGLGTVYGFQVFLTVGGVTKFIPSTGVTLPLVSYGGSSLFSTMIMFAVVQGLYIRRQDEGAANERKNAAPPRRRKTGFDEDVETFS